MEVKKWQMIEASKNENPNSLKEVEHLCEAFGFTITMIKRSLADGREKK